jgi:transposase
MNEKIKLHRMEAGDCEALLALISDMRRKTAVEFSVDAIVASCFEAGRDGFWLHRFLLAHGVINHVVEPTSILVTRGARRAKTDRLDAQGLLRVLAAKFTGDHDACRVVNVPSVSEEDAKRPHREREYLVQDRIRIENRIAALLATQGISKRPSLRSWEADLNAVQTGDGRSIPPLLKAELNRLRRRLVITLDMIREVEAERQQAVAEQDDPASRTVAALCKLRGIGDNFAAVLTREIFYRSFENRRQIASYLGLAPTPFQSGGVDRDRRINRAGNSRARKTLIQLAWLWLRYQPESSVAQWFRQRVGALQGRTRRIAIVAMARKLLIAIWRFATLGIVTEGAIVAA